MTFQYVECPDCEGWGCTDETNCMTCWGTGVVEDYGVRRPEAKEVEIPDHANTGDVGGGSTTTPEA